MRLRRHTTHKPIMSVVHGDDFTGVGIKHDLDWLDREIGKKCDMKIRGRMGPSREMKDIRLLNRIVR